MSGEDFAILRALMNKDTEALVYRARAMSKPDERLAREMILALADALENATFERTATCEFGCGPGGPEYVNPGFGIVPACPVHGWIAVAMQPVADLRAALEHAASKQQHALAVIRENGFVFTEIGNQPGNWQHLAFTFYNDLCDIEAHASAVLRDTVPSDTYRKESSMVDDETTQPDEPEDDPSDANPEADAEAEEGDVAPPPPAPLDLDAFWAEVDQRKALMEERGRVDIDTTYVGWADNLRAQTDEALSVALRAEAERRTAAQAAGPGPYQRRRLAAKVVAGEYDTDAVF